MPKLRMTDQQRREKALMRALEKAKFENDLKYDIDVANRLGIVPCLLYTSDAADE